MAPRDATSETVRDAMSATATDRDVMTVNVTVRRHDATTATGQDATTATAARRRLVARRNVSRCFQL